jgi:hypothetical protein
MRRGVVIVGIVILLLGLIIASASRKYASLTGELVGAYFSVLGLITGLVGVEANQE